MGDEPLFIGVLVTIATGSATWIGVMLHKGLGKIDQLVSQAERFDRAIYGDSKEPKPNGLIRAVDEIDVKLEGHIKDQGNFNLGITKAIAEHHRMLDKQALKEHS